VRSWPLRPLARAGLLLVVVLVVAGGLVVRHRLGPKHLLTVTPGVLYRSGQLTPGQLEDVVDRYGIRTVVNLRSENERSRGDWYEGEVERLESLGVRHMDLPMNAGFPPRDDQLARWRALLEDGEAHPVLVHYEYGVIRTGIMVGVYEVEQLGLSAAGALSRFVLFGHEVDPPTRKRIESFFDGYPAAGGRS